MTRRIRCSRCNLFVKAKNEGGVAAKQSDEDGTQEEMQIGLPLNVAAWTMQFVYHRFIFGTGITLFSSLLTLRSRKVP